jgi:acetyl esterase/lipase
MRFFAVILAILFLSGCSPLAYINLQVSQNLQVDQNIPYGQEERQILDVYTREDIPSKGTIIYVHGGYWDTGDKSDYPFLADSLTEQGFTTVVVNYRLVPSVTFPSYVEDVALAVKWTVDNIAEYGGNLENIFLMGHSAGGHIAALVAYDARYLNRLGLSNQDLSGFIGFAGGYDFLPIDPTDLRTIAALGAEETYPDTQPINFVDSSDPPAFLAYTLNDNLVNPNNSPRFAEKIEAVGGYVELHEYDGVDHVSIIGTLGRASRFLNEAVLEDLVAFLNLSLR